MSAKDLLKSKVTKEPLKEVRKGSVSAGSESPPTSKMKELEKQRKKGTTSPVVISGASPSISQGSGQTRPLPSHTGIQFDSYETSFTSKALSKDPLPALVTWPEDDVLVEDQKRKLRTSKPTLPVRAEYYLLCVCATSRHAHRDCCIPACFTLVLYFIKEPDLNQNEASYINTLTTMFTKPWRVVSRPHLAESLNSELKDNYETLPDVDYEVDRPTAEPADHSENKIEKSSELAEYVAKERDADMIRKELRGELSKNRETLMMAVPMELVIDTVDPRPKGKLLSDELVGVQIFVEPTELSFELGVHEPFFGTMALYDLKRREKVSESWNFDLNPPVITELLGVHCGDREPATLAKSCVFSTSYQSPDIYMVVMFSTTLHGEESEALAPYLNSKIKDKEKDKFVTEARLSTQRLGGYRQPFGYTAIQLFDDNNTIRLSKETVIPSLMKPKGERDIYNLIEKFLDKSKGKTIIPVKFSMTVKKLGEKDHLKGRLTPSLQTVKPVSKGDRHKVIREIGDFSASSPEGALRQMPNLNYENTLYLLPDTVNFGHASGATSSRNIAIEVRLHEDDDDIHGQGLPLIYGNSVTSALTHYARSHVYYHSRKPVWFDEIKVRLPTFLTSKHHLTVTFSHLTCALQKGKPNANIETLVGRATIPIYPENRLIRDGRYTIPVAINLPDSGYLAETPETPRPREEAIKWIDNGKPIFSFRVKTVSTIYPQDNALDEFFKQFEVYKPAENEDHKMLVAAINGLANAEKQKVIEYFPAVFDLLFRIMSTSGTMTQSAAFNAVLNIVDTVHSNSYTNHLLESYVQYLFDNHQAGSTSFLCEVLVEIWFYQILVAKTAWDNAIKYSWFMFLLLYKSMVLMLKESDQLSSNGPRKERFHASFIPLLNKLVTQLAIKTKELCSTSHSSESRKLYQTVGLFLRDLFTIMDRGAVFEMIYRFVFELDPDNEATPQVVECKFQFLRIICNFEHYLPLNLPLADDLSGVTVTEIKAVYWRRHFLAGLLLDEISKCLSKPTSVVRVSAILTLRDLFWKHDHDPRYNSSTALKERIAQIYFPYVLMLIDHWHIMQENVRSYTFHERRSWLICFIWVLKNINRSLVQNWWKRDSTPKRKKAFLAILADCLLHFEYSGHSLFIKQNSSPHHSISNASLTEPLSTSTDSTGSSGDHEKKRRKHASKVRKPQLSFGGHLGGTLPHGFDPKAALESYYPSRTTTQGSVDMANTDRGSVGGGGGGGGGSGGSGFNTILTPAAIVKKEQNLGREVPMVVLDIMMDFVNDHRNELIKKENVEPSKFEAEKLFEKTFDIFLRLLQCNQAKSVTILLLNQFQWIIPKFRTPLFRYRSAVCGALTYEIVKHMNSKWASARALACGALLLMIKHNYEEVKNFSRMKLQSSVAISQLFATAVLDHGADGLKDALSAIRYHAMAKFNKEKTKHGSLGIEVKELVARLEHVIEDNLKMEEYSFDPETKADLYHQISRGYADSPDLRTTELEKLAQMHHRDGNFEECAMVRIAQAVLVGEYLRLLGRMGTEAMPTNSIQVFPNLAGEITLPKKQELETLESEICQSRIFTEDGFVMLLAQAVTKLKEQMLFESCVEVYRLLLPIYQFRRNYLRQSECYQDLHQLCISSVEQMQTNNRIFAQYYRVAFFGGGEKLQELDGQQFIYKENGAVRIDGITERLSEQFSAKIAKEKIHFVSNINFERASMQVGHLYIQLVSVEPYLTPDELESKPTLFQQHFNVSTFIYETPFYKGKDKEKLSEQWKKKTILTADGAFPSIKKRLPIKSVQTLELTPIETATELIVKKAQSLRAELAKTPVNTKTLQRELQGTLLLQVNAGPAAIATEFLDGPTASSATAAHKQQLCDAFISFVRLLAEGVSANNALITVEQLTLQSELKNGYFRLKALVCKLTDTPEDEIEQNFSPDLPEATIMSSMDSPPSLATSSYPALSSATSSAALNATLAASQ